MSDGTDNTGTDDQKKLTDDPAFKEMQNAIKGIALLVQQGQTAQAKTQENFNTLMQKITPKEPDKDDRDPDAEKDAINDLDNAGLLRLVVGEVGKVVDKKIGGVSDTLSKTNQDLNDSRLATAVKERMIGHPDLLDWKDEMAALAKDNPNLGIDRLHNLVRAENPEKAEELDGKYTSDDDKEAESGYLGLMPTGGGFIDDDSGEKPLTADEALEKAWDETISDFPQLGIAGDG